MTEKDNFSLIRLQDDKTNEIRYIYHISDIHIRNNNKRHDEYKEVFERLYLKIKSLVGSNKDDSLIVVTGDIMHSKTELSPESIKLVWQFFKNLSKILSVIAIPGNHDCNLSNKERLDAISPILEDIGRLSNFYYLKKSGYYQYYNIIFGVTSIYDDKLIKASDVTKQMKKSINQKKKYLIALFHGTIHRSSEDIGYKKNKTDFLVEDFKGYDYVMLGDIHKFQYMNEEKTIAYAGSLIQQTFGESPKGHGVLQWDLFEGTSKHIEILNDYGFCTLKIINGELQKEKIPKKPYLRFQLENTTEKKYQEIYSSIEKNHNIQGVFKEQIVSNIAISISSNVNKISNSLKNQEDFICKYLKAKKKTSEEVESLLDLHKKIHKEVSSSHEIDNFSTNHEKSQCWSIIELRFSNMLSYGEKNVIDFRNYNHNNIIGIFAPNHYGKSAILDIILFCLFYKFTRSSKNSIRDIINKNKSSMDCSLLFKIGSQQYLIERTVTINGERTENSVNLYELTDDVKTNINGKDNRATNKIIVDKIGNYDDYLATCFCLQGKNNSFIDMTEKERKEYLYSILKLNIFEECYKYAVIKSNAVQSNTNFLKNKTEISKKYTDCYDEIHALKSKIESLESKKSRKINDCRELIDDLIKKYKSGSLPIYKDLEEYDLNSSTDILKTIEMLEKKIKNESTVNNIVPFNADEIREKIKQSVSKLADMKKIHESFNLDEEIDKLWKTKTAIPNDKLSSNQIEELHKEIKKNKKRIEIIESTLKSYYDENKTNDISDKINRFEWLMMENQRLQTKIIPINQKLIDKLPDMQKQLETIRVENNIAFLEIIKNGFVHYDTNTHSLSVINEILGILNEISDATSSMIFENDCQCCFQNMVRHEAINKILNNKREKYQIISDLLKKENPSINIVKIKKSLENERIIYDQINNAFEEILNKKSNNLIEESIKKNLEELTELSVFNGTKKEIDNLKQEKNLLEKQISISSEQLKKNETYADLIKKNEKIDKEISEIREKIKDQKRVEKLEQQEIDIMQNKLNEHEKRLKIDMEKTLLIEKWKRHIKHLNEYYYKFITWMINNDNHHNYLTNKKNIEKQIADLEKEIDKKKTEMFILEKEYEQIKNNKIEFEKINKENNLYKDYLKLMNYNGIPYAILKDYLPKIESQVNEILRHVVEFSLKLVFMGGNEGDEKKVCKTKKIETTIDINICYNGIKSYNVQLASGFEKFIIGLAIRMALSHISLSSKPNFIIIDEGWSCLDSDNLNNLNNIMEYIKSQYDHVIIISHIEELKNQADYIINIDKNKNGYSYLNTTTGIMKNN